MDKTTTREQKSAPRDTSMNFGIAKEAILSNGEFFVLILYGLELIYYQTMRSALDASVGSVPICPREYVTPSRSSVTHAAPNTDYSFSFTHASIHPSNDAVFFVANEKRQPTNKLISPVFLHADGSDDDVCWTPEVKKSWPEHTAGIAAEDVTSAPSEPPPSPTRHPVMAQPLTPQPTGRPNDITLETNSRETSTTEQVTAATEPGAASSSPKHWVSTLILAMKTLVVHIAF